MNDSNSQDDVERAIVSDLGGSGLELLAVAKTDRQMMSLVFGRLSNAALVGEIASLPGLFDSWLLRLRTQASVASQPYLRLDPTTAGPHLPALPRMPRRRRG